jgi:phage shock protein E
MSNPIQSDTFLVDVRSPAEFVAGHLKGALNVPLDQLQGLAPRLLPDREADLVLYCASGARSAFGCAVLAQMGYQRVRNGGGAGQLSLVAQIPVQRG